jgi:hypothetical protein
MEPVLTPSPLSAYFSQNMNIFYSAFLKEVINDAKAKEGG